MNRVVRRKLAVAKRVRDFCRAQPADTPGFLEVMEELEWRLGRVAELVGQRLLAAHGEDGGTSHRAVIRSTIRDKYLRNLVRIGRGAADLDPILLTQFKLPRKNLGGVAFLARATALIDVASQHQDLFIRDGMPATFVTDAMALLARYSQLLESEEGSNHNLQTLHEINQLTAGMVRLLKRLDGINMLRFQEDPEMLQAWQAVRSASPAKTEPGCPEDGLDPAA